MKRTLRWVGIVAILMIFGIAGTGCSSVSTPPDMVALHYSGGSWSNQKFVECIPVSTRDNFQGMAENHYYFPTRVVSYDATGGSSSESGAFTIVSKDSAEMKAPVTVNMVLDTSCTPLNADLTPYKGKNPDASYADGGPRWPGGKLQAFWETIGRKYDADVDKDTQTSDGWVDLLNYVVGKPLDTTYDRVAQDYNWRDLWNDPSTKSAVEKEVALKLPELVNRQGQGKWFSEFDVLVLKPDPTNDKLKNAVADEQAAVAKANAAREAALADKARAEAQIAVERAEAAKIQERVNVLGKEGYLKQYAIDHGLNPFPPTGEGLLVNSNK